MKFHPITVGIVAVFLSFSSVACSSSQNAQIVETGGKSQVELRSVQSRVFKTGDKQKTMRTVIACLQDLGFVLDKAHMELGTVTGTRLDGHQLRMSVTVRQRDSVNMLIRANCNVDLQPITEPLPYQQFYEALAKAMFLEAHPIE